MASPTQFETLATPLPAASGGEPVPRSRRRWPLFLAAQIATALAAVWLAGVPAYVADVRGWSSEVGYAD